MTSDTDRIWAGSKRDLEDKLSERYGVENLWFKGDHYDEERDGMVYDALVYFDGDVEHLITDDVPVYGHGPSGAAAVDSTDLPAADEVKAVVGQS